MKRLRDYGPSDHINIRQAPFTLNFIGIEMVLEVILIQTRWLCSE